MIYFFTPYAINRRLGEAYNQYCEIVPNDDDWICLTDGDTCFLTPDYGFIISRAIEIHGANYALLTCYTNRVACPLQRIKVKGASTNRDILFHRNLAHNLAKENRGDVLPIKEPIGGFFLLFQKQIWKSFPFPDVTNRGTLLGIDRKWSSTLLAHNLRIGLIANLYLFHYYRLAGEGQKHLS
jgi:hypothetical protein